MKNIAAREIILFLILCIFSFAFLLSVESCEQPKEKAVHKIKKVVKTGHKKHEKLKRATPVVQDIN